MTRFFLFLLLATCSTAGIKAQKKPDLQSVEDSIAFYLRRNNAEKANRLAEQLELKTRKKNGLYSADYATAKQIQGDVLRRTNHLPEAKVAILKSLEIRQKLFGSETPETAKSLFSLGHWYFKSGSFNKADSLYQRVLEIRKKTEVPVADLGSIHHSLGNLHTRMGQYSQAEAYYREAIRLGNAPQNTDQAWLADAYNGIGVLYNEQKKYEAAEYNCLKACEIWKAMHGENHLKMAFPYNNLGTLYEKLGDYGKARFYLTKSVAILKNAYGENHEDVADGYNNLAVMFLETKNLTEAELYLTRALSIRKAIKDTEPSVLADAVFNLGNFYYFSNQYPKAKIQYDSALSMYRKLLRENHPEMALLHTNLAAVSSRMRDWKEAETQYLKSLAIHEQVFNDFHESVAIDYHRIAMVHFAQGKMATAEENFMNFRDRQINLLQTFFPYLSDNEKEKYTTKIQPYLNSFKSFCIQRYAGDNSIACDLYNLQVATKGILLHNSVRWREEAKNSPQPTVKALFDTWTVHQARINDLFLSTDSAERAELSTVLIETEKIEKAISKLSGQQSGDKASANKKWEHIQASLKTGEAAVEIIRTPKTGFRLSTSDSNTAVYYSFEATDTIEYVALIIKKESKYPEMIKLNDGNALENKYLAQYKKSIRRHEDSHQLYQPYWGKINVALTGIHTVYFSGDGVYHKLNLNTLQNPVTKKYILEEKDIRLVTCTKDLTIKQVQPDSSTAVLIGNPQFYRTATESEAMPRPKKPWLTLSGSLTPLSSSAAEIKEINSILQSNKWKSTTYTETNAGEKEITNLHSPTLLHVATHGFFQPDSTGGSLYRSGLLLANAGNTLSGQPVDTLYDGILTAAEAMNMDLTKTDLVILSACETGLGEIKNGEGVYGIQRAFIVAGASSVIMSLWKVSDAATQELMVAFYKHWLNPGSNQHKTNRARNQKASFVKPGSIGGFEARRTAFLAAQKEVKAKYKSAFYWGAFVLVGN